MSHLLKVLVLLAKLFLLCLVLFPLFLFLHDIYNDRQHRVIVYSDTPLFSSPENASYPQKRNLTPIRNLHAGEQVKVMRTTYGKDYWAICIETNDGTRGWVDSGQPGIEVLKPNAE